MTNEQEIKFLFLSPVLASDNIERDISWYGNKMGFKSVYDSTSYKVGKIDYAIIGRQNLFLHLQFQYTKDLETTRASIKFEVRNIEGLYEEFLSTGLLKTDTKIRKTDWNTREFCIKDLSGNTILFLEDM